MAMDLFEEEQERRVPLFCEPCIDRRPAPLYESFCEVLPLDRAAPLGLVLLTTFVERFTVSLCSSALQLVDVPL